VADDDVQDMRDHAERFRRLARVVEDERNRRQLLEMAQELDKGADGLEQARSKKR
jgi:tetrahydromethanopterin S-methyltransferase subunit F